MASQQDPSRRSSNRVDDIPSQVPSKRNISEIYSKTPGPDNKKSKLDTSTTTAAVKSPENENSQPPAELEKEDLTKPILEFNFDEQVFANMFASSEVLHQKFKPGDRRPIIIDGSNVAFSHGNHTEFSEQGILICLDYFQQRKHLVKIFVPRYHQTFFTRATAKDLEEKGILTFTPSRMVDGKRISSYDDRYTLQYATVTQGLVVSNDNYRDLYDENPRFHEVIKNRLLPFTWPSKEVLMFPTDPLGRRGPTLEKLLIFPVPIPTHDDGYDSSTSECEDDPGNLSDSDDDL